MTQNWCIFLKFPICFDDVYTFCDVPRMNYTWLLLVTPLCSVAREQCLSLTVTELPQSETSAPYFPPPSSASGNNCSILHFYETNFSNSQWGWRHDILSRKAQEYLGYLTSHTTLVTSILCQVGRFWLLRAGTLSLCKSLQSLYLLMTPEVAPNSWPVRTVLQWTWKRMLILNKVISVPLDYDKLIRR